MSWISDMANSVSDMLSSKEKDNHSSGHPQKMEKMERPPSDMAFIELPQMPWRKKKREPPLKLETAPFDPRFPNQNQTRYCYQSFLDYHRCRKVKGESYKPCEYFFKCYKSLCPNAWIEKWNEQLENGTFPGKI